MKVKEESRICFGIEWYDSEQEAEEIGARVRAAGERYNGGWFDGMPCGRDKQYDMTTDDGQQLFAVTRS